LDLSPTSFALIIAVFLIAGSVKGLIGVGLPTVALALMIHALPFRDAVTLIVVPAIATNIWQALRGGNARPLFRRFWPFLITLCLGTWLGVGILASSDQRMLSGIFGGILASYALVGLLRPVPPPPGRHERWLSPILGIVNGLINGATGTYAFPSIVYLESLHLVRDELIQGMGLIFLTSSAALGLALSGHGVMHLSNALLSAVALAPSLAGYYVGESYRRKLPQETFRLVFLLGLLVLGAYTLLSQLVF
jgi:uncharacterized protein